MSTPPKPSQLVRAEVPANRDLTRTGIGALGSEGCDAGTGRRVLEEISADAAVDGVGEALLVATVAQALLLTGIGDVRGLDQHRGDVGRLEHDETGLLHGALA